MVKSREQFVCQSCGSVYSRWAGKCEGCGEWNTIHSESAEATPKGMSLGKGKSLDLVPLDGEIEASVRKTTGMAELDRVLGGGLVAGSAILIGGDPGIGKSTLLLQTVSALSKSGLKTVYISGEESVTQVRLRAKRLGLNEADVSLAASTSVRDIVHNFDGKDAPDVVVIDSIQTMYVDNIESAPGTVSQVRASSHELIKLAKKRNMALFIVGHVTKDGQIAGPRVLEHMVDTVLYFEGERGHQFRILRAVKNRFGGTDEIGVFEMSDAGLREVANPSALFLADREGEVSGACVFAGMEGSRPILLEVQALVSSSSMSNPRRAVVGWDVSRLNMILAVLEARSGIKFSDKEVYLNVAGGLKITEPAADLAMAAALISALTHVPLKATGVVFGEVGLSGEIRQVGRAEARLKESEKLGFVSAIVPKKTLTKGLGIRLEGVSHIDDVVRIFQREARTMAEVTV